MQSYCDANNCSAQNQSCVLHKQTVQSCCDASSYNAQHRYCLLRRQTVQSWRSRCPCLLAMAAARQLHHKCSQQRSWPRAARSPPSLVLHSARLQRSRTGCSHPLPTSLPTSQGMRACQSTEVSSKVSACIAMVQMASPHVASVMVWSDPGHGLCFDALTDGQHCCNQCQGLSGVCRKTALKCCNKPHAGCSQTDAYVWQVLICIGAHRQSGCHRDGTGCSHQPGPVPVTSTASSTSTRPNSCSCANPTSCCA